jgi:predicted dehydrogenase
LLALAVNRYGAPFPEGFRDAWRISKAQSGGLLFEVHVHEFDYSRYVAGNPETVYAVTRKVGPDKGIDFDDLIMGIIQFEKGEVGEYHFSHISARSECQMALFMEKGVISCGFGGATVKTWEGEESELPALDGSETKPYRKEIQLFAEAVLTGQPMPISGEEGLWAVAMAEGFEKSAASGQPVSIPDLLRI